MELETVSQIFHSDLFFFFKFRFFTGDKLCGDKKMKFWADEMGHLSLIISLQCTPDGWSDGAKIVKPEYVRCEKFA